MATVDTTDEIGGSGTSLTTPGVTPGGTNGAVYILTNAQHNDTPVYATEVKENDNSGALIDDFTGSNQLIDIFGFTGGNANTWGKPGVTATPLDIYLEWAISTYSAAGFAIFVEGADQTTPFGTEVIEASTVLGTPAGETKTLTFSGLTPGQLCIGGFLIIAFADTITSVTATDANTTVLGLVDGAELEGRECLIAGVSGVADGDGDCVLSVVIVYSTAGGFTAAGARGVPVNDAAGGGLDQTITPSGGITYAGSAAFTRTRIFGPTGGITYGGTAPITFESATINDITPSGGYVLAGTAPFTRTRVISVSGGLVLGGTSPFNRSHVISPSGGIEYAGSARLGFTKTLNPSGGISFAGSAPISFTPAGGVVGAVGSRLRLVGIGTMQ